MLQDRQCIKYITTVPKVMDQFNKTKHQWFETKSIEADKPYINTMRQILYYDARADFQRYMIR